MKQIELIPLFLLAILPSTTFTPACSIGNVLVYASVALLLGCPNMFFANKKQTYVYNIVVLLMMFFITFYLWYSDQLFSCGKFEEGERFKSLWPLSVFSLIILISLYSIAIYKARITPIKKWITIGICTILSAMILCYEIDRDTPIRKAISEGNEIVASIDNGDMKSINGSKIQSGQTICQEWNIVYVDKERYMLIGNMYNCSKIVHSTDDIPCVVYKSEDKKWRYVEYYYVEYDDLLNNE